MEPNTYSPSYPKVNQIYITCANEFATYFFNFYKDYIISELILHINEAYFYSQLLTMIQKEALIEYVKLIKRELIYDDEIVPIEERISILLYNIKEDFTFQAEYERNKRKTHSKCINSSMLISHPSEYETLEKLFKEINFEK
jgi:hypothetical protein